jgi:septal ring factor EnvC (AmiA/AmiB activator)
MRPAPPRPVLRCLAGLLALLLASTAVADGGDAAAKQQQLDKLRSRLTRVQTDRDQALHRRDTLQVQLRQEERQIATQAKVVSDLDRQVNAAQSRLADLTRQQSGLQASLDAQKSALAEQIRAAYMEGRHSQLKLMLDAQDPASVGRMLAYYDYLNRARVARIGAVHQQLEALAAVDAQISKQVTDLTSLRDSRAKSLTDLEQQRSARRNLLANINSSIRSRDAEISRLKRDQQSLQSLLDDLEKAMTDIPPGLEQAKHFAALRGRLPWPVPGKLVAHYGEKRAGGRMKWEGDLIAAAPGTPVHSVSYGRVVYADWMPRFGLLVIVDHGDGYLSVYAHNQSVSRQVGEWVKAGDTLATLGDSGGQDEPGLYFELRHNSQTLDPKKWLRGRLPSN